MFPLRQIAPLLIFALCGTAAAGTLPTHRLDAGPGTVRTVRARDLTGDGIADLVAFTDGRDGIAILIWCADPRGAYPNEKPDLVVRPKEMGLGAVYYVFLATLRRGEPATLVLVDREKDVVALTVVFAKEKWTIHGPEKIATAPKLPFYPDDRRIAVLDAAADVDADGDDELILPTGDGYAIVDVEKKAKDDEEAAVRIVDTGTKHYLTAGAHRFFSLNWHIPRILVADWDGDGIPDLIAGRGRNVLLYLQREDGSFLAERRRVDLLVPEPWAKESSTFKLADVDGDGRIDLLLTRTPTSVKVMGEFSSEHSLFLNPRIFSPRTEGHLLTPPADHLRTGGTSINPTLFDFEGDGDLDLLVSSLKIDLGSQIRRDVSAEYSLFLFDAETKRFKSSSLFDVTRTYPWERLQRGTTGPVCFFDGDFDGDNLLDLVNIADDGHLTILTGETGSGLWATKYDFTEEEDGKALFRAKASVTSDVIIRDLNRDGASDLVAYRGDKVFVIRGVKR